MTQQNTFPAPDPLEDSLRLAGSLRYEPRVHFVEPLMRLLQEVLDQGLDIGGCENPDVVADWCVVAYGPGSRMTHRSNIVLFHDGGDWAEEHDGHYEGEGVLFCRQDIDQTVEPAVVSYRVHIPGPEEQDRPLAACNGVIGDLARAHPDKLNALRVYLGSILGDQAAWKTHVQLVGEQGLSEAGIPC